jgi:hypothetical protein
MRLRPPPCAGRNHDRVRAMISSVLRPPRAVPLRRATAFSTAGLRACPARLHMRTAHVVGRVSRTAMAAIALIPLGEQFHMIGAP